MWLTLQQTKCLMYKNFLIKRRDKKQFFQELLYPVYMVGILAMVRALVRPQNYPIIENFPRYSLDNINTIFNRNNTILFAPNDNAAVINIMKKVDQFLGMSSPSIGFINSTDLELHYLFGNNSKNVVGGVIFESYQSNNISYTIRLPENVVPSSTWTITNRGFCRQSLNHSLANNCPANLYLTSGFAVLQNAIERSITLINVGLPDTFPKSNFSFQLMPKNEYTGGVDTIQIYVSIYFVLAYSPFINFLLVGLVTEKEKKIKEGMKMMGLQTAAFWLSWFLTYALVILLCTIIVTIITSVASLYRVSNPFIIFLLLFLYGLSVVNFAFMLTPFFNKASVAGAIGSLATIAFAALYFPVTLFPTPPIAKWLLALLSPVALALSLSQATALETTVGAQFNNMWVGQFPIAGGLLMLALDVFLYLGLAIYFDMIMPKEYGQQYSPLFCFTPSFWRGLKSKNAIGEPLNDVTTNSQCADVEDIPANLSGKEAIRIVGITKSFADTSNKKKEMKAVDNFSLDVYEGQITALLGHNGAGKTTLIATLTGLLPTTRGTAYIYNYNINNPEDMRKIREITGVCPQHDILFDALSPREHLRIFATIKGIPKNQIEATVNKILEDVLLSEKASTKATNLSGGQKRKLSVGIALIGDPKIVYLDEPTSGMDPLSRRQIWSLLQSRREGRVILLTTHFMDEADILADRKAVMSHGRLRCAGSSLFLKNRFGIGYHLGMVVKPDSPVKDITQLVREHTPEAKLKRSHAGELSYLLPLSDVPKFRELFTHLESPANHNSGESCAEVYGITSYGISMTTLEEVFLKLRDHSSEDLTSMVKVPLTGSIKRNDNNLASSPIQDDTSSPKKDTFDFGKDRQLTTKELIKQQIMALFKIRLLIMRRNPLAVFFRFALPPVFIILGLVFSNNITQVPSNVRDPPSIKLLPELYLNTTNPPPSLKIFANLLIRNSTAESISWFIDHLSNKSISYQMSNLSDDYLLNHYPHTFGYDVTEFQNSTTGVSASVCVLHNDTALHSIPIAMNLINQMRFEFELMQRTGKSVGGTKIYVKSKPMPRVSAGFGYNSAAMAAPLFIGLALNTIPAGFAIEVTRDRQDKVRQLLRASGVTSSVYWFSLFMSDFLTFLYPVLILLIVIPIMNVSTLTIPAAMGVLVMTILAYLPANVLMAYALSFMFSTVETCESVLPSILNMGFLLPTIGVSLADMLGQPTVGLVIHYIMLVINPTYPIGGVVYYMSQLYLIYTFRFRGQPIPASAYFSPTSPIPYCILLPIFHTIFFYYLLRYLDYRNTGSTDNQGRCCGKSQKKRPMTVNAEGEISSMDEKLAATSGDEDVRAEYERITNLRDNSSVALKVKHIHKEFPKRADTNNNKKSKKNMVAVQDLCFGVEQGEIFGLLGPNGAGKTTTLNIVTGDMSASRGEVCVAGHELGVDITQALRSLGFCPQHDALWERITLAEHLHAYAAIKGVPKDSISEVVDRFIQGMDIQEHAKKFSKNLSGGTKRKLSFGMSIIGCPRLILMDEPSTGMDPDAKRFLWNSITASITGKTGAVITTHSMEEADALCARVGIMVRGQLRCLGSTQHLKNKYGGGYHLEIKFLPYNVSAAPDRDPLDAVISFVRESFCNAQVVEHFGQRIIFKIPSADVKSLGKSFASLEEGKASVGIVEYSFSQSTLEQVFLEFAKRQDDDEDESDHITQDPEAPLV